MIRNSLFNFRRLTIRKTLVRKNSGTADGTKLSNEIVTKPIHHYTRLFHYAAFGSLFLGFKIIHYVQYHKESGLRGQMVVCGLDESVDNGLIGYSDPKFEFYSPLNEENQQKIHDYIDSLRPILDEKLADPNYKIVFVLDSPSSMTEDAFSILSIRRADESYWTRALDFVTFFGEFAKDNTLVLINTAAVVSDVTLLKDLHERKGRKITGEDYGAVYKYLRSTTMSNSQMKSLSELNLKLQQHYDNSYPIDKILLTPLVANLPTLLTSSLFYAAVGTLIAVLGSFVTDGYFIGTYETEKRNIIKEHLKNMNEKDIAGMLTHLYRAQDYFTRSQKVEVFEESTIDDSEENSFFISFKLLLTSLQEELNPNVPNEKFIEELLSDVNHRIEENGLSIDVDPYEIYKDDEGYDYYFVA